MSDFTPDGFLPFPNTIGDAKKLHTVADWSDSRIEDKVVEYWSFLDREDLMPRAIKAAHRILDHLGFEMDYRYGAYDYVNNETGYLDGTAEV